MKRRWRAWLFGFACWTVLGLFFATQTQLAYGNWEQRLSWMRAVRLALVEYWIWGALSIPILWLARRLPFERKRWGRAMAVHLPASVVFSLASLILYSGIARRLDPTVPMAMYRTFIPLKIHPGVLIYWILVGFSYFRQRELRASQLETRLVEAKLQMLRMQLQPHFLFNTLHAISTLMHRDVEAADQMLARLSDLLRIALEDSAAREVTLKRELEFVERYLAIEKIRFADRLNVEMTIDRATRDALVPNLLLQPLVENAVRHGIAAREKQGLIAIRTARRDGRLRIEIVDDGAGLKKGFSEGVGLGNTRARLQQMYGPGHTLSLEPGATGGLRVVVEIPFRE